MGDRFDSAPSEFGAPVFDHDDAPASLSDYELGEELGKGGMGVVYEARQISLNRKVAIKMLPSVLLAGEEAIERFKKEAEATAAIDHPNIVPVYEVGESDGQPFMTMKLIEGQPLSKLGQQLLGKPRDIAELTAKIARAVHAAHKNGILHRDLKPGNILIDEKNGEPHVADFGLAKRLDEEADSQLTLTGQVLGTPGFMAPEQAAGKAATTAADVYAIGAILYQLITGQPPFSGTTVAKVLRQIEEEPPARPSSSVSVDGDLEAITMKCLEKEPPHRYDSASTLADDLERWLRGEPVNARPVSGVQRVVRWAKRKPVPAALAITIALFVLTLAIGGPLVALHQARLRAEMRQQLYFSEMAAACEASNSPSGFPKVRQLLANWEGADAADLRGWEWRFLDTLTKPQGEVFVSRDSPIRGFALGPKRERYAIENDQFIEIRSVETHEVQWRSERVSGYVRGLAFSHDGRFLSATKTHKSRVLIFDIESNAEPKELEATTSGTMRPWNSAKNVFVAQQGRQVDLLRPDGSRIDGFVPKYYEDYFYDWRPDGSAVLLHFPPDNIVEIPGTEPVQLDEPLLASALKIGPGGNRAAIGDRRGNVRVLDLKTWELSSKLPAHESQVNGLAWSPDGRHFASVGDDFSLQIHDAAGGERVELLRGHEGPVHGVLWPESERILTWSEDGSVRDWRPFARPDIRTSQPHHLAAIDWSPDGSRLAAAYSDIVTFDFHGPPVHSLIVSDATNDLVWMPNGRDVAIFVRDQVVIAPPGRLNANQLPEDLIRLHRHDNIGFAIELHPSNPWLASAGNDGVRVSNFETGELIREATGFAARELRFHPKTQQLLACALESPSEIRLIDVNSGEVKSVARPSGSHAHALDFHPGGELLATGSSDAVIEFWEHPTGRRLAALSGHTGEVTALAFSPDGKRLASASRDTTIRIWDVATRTEICALRGHESAVLSLAWSPDGETLASCGQAGEVKIWSARETP